MMNVNDIRQKLKLKLSNGEYVIDKTGVKTIELLSESFIADEPAIVGTVNQDYINREIEWYESESLYVDDIPGETPAIWNVVSSKHGRINSNYGWCIHSRANSNQYDNCLKALVNDKDTRRGIMVYNRPSMQYEYNADGMSDFMCTNTVQYVIRDNKLHALVNMRSNDAWAGFRNDLAWQKHVLNDLTISYNGAMSEKYSSLRHIEMGNIYWCAGSLHLYERQFYLLDHWSKTGEWITKTEYSGKWK